MQPGWKLKKAAESRTVPGTTARLAREGELRELPRKGPLPHLVQRVLQREPQALRRGRCHRSLTQHLPPKGVHYLRRSGPVACPSSTRSVRPGLYSSRSRGKWTDKPYVVRLAPQGWRHKHLDSPDSPEAQQQCDPDRSVCSIERRSAWARLIARVYDVDPLVCPRCGSQMRVIAVAQDPDEVQRILAGFRSLRLELNPPQSSRSHRSVIFSVTECVSARQSAEPHP